MARGDFTSIAKDLITDVIKKRAQVQI